MTNYSTTVQTNRCEFCSLYEPDVFYTKLNVRIRLSFISGPVIIYDGDCHRREMFFKLGILITQPLKRETFFCTQPSCINKNNLPNLYKTSCFHFDLRLRCHFYHYLKLPLLFTILGKLGHTYISVANTTRSHDGWLVD